jgi:brefeldin A-inhibited guanine nucleotide-exchange protein
MFSRIFIKDNPKSESTFSALTDSSDVFIRVALELLTNAPVTKRNDALKKAIAASFKALDSLPKDSPTMMIVFSPFQIACQSKNSELITIAIDCLGKLFTYNFWGQYNLDGISELTKNSKVTVDLDDIAGIDDGDVTGVAGMISFVIDTIASSYSGVDERAELQIVKALQAAVSTANPSFCLHGSVLIKAIRTTYNIFLVSNSTNVQAVAQGALTQMILNVYGRIPKGMSVSINGEG